MLYLRSEPQAVRVKKKGSQARKGGQQCAKMPWVERLCLHQLAGWSTQGLRLPRSCKKKLPLWIGNLETVPSPTNHMVCWGFLNPSWDRLGIGATPTPSLGDQCIQICPRCAWILYWKPLISANPSMGGKVGHLVAPTLEDPGVSLLQLSSVTLYWFPSLSSLTSLQVSTRILIQLNSLPFSLHHRDVCFWGNPCAVRTACTQ